ncbi:MAG: MerR family transcriptional regulator [Oscillospiraceae bacterium]|nr:MerR family transcriptional regulator [Oscillospiraceae bacterium]
MFKIGEFSKMVRVSARMLRHYESAGLLVPAQVDQFTGYRLYSATQMPLLARITQLRDMGFGVEEIKALLPLYNNPTTLREALERKAGEVQATLATEQSKLEKIAALSGQLQKERVSMVFDVELKSLPAEKVLSLREIIPAPEHEPAQWEKMAAFIQANNIAFDKAGGYSIYHDEDYKETDVDVETVLRVNELGESQGSFIFKVLPAIPQAATVQFSGPYEEYVPAIEKLAGWLETNGYVMDGMVRGLAINTYYNTEHEEDFLTELQLPVRKT